MINRGKCKKIWFVLRDVIITTIILCLSFGTCLVIHTWFQTGELIPAVFILGVFLTSAITDGYRYGIISSLISVLAVNYAFTFPYFKVNFTIPENLVSAIIMIVISLITCGYTTRFKHSEAIKAEGEKEKMRANLLRAVSHDLRTPLTAIYGASSAILENETKLSEEQKHMMLKGIQEESQWLSRMVENLLSITKLDGGNVKIIKTPTALDELIDSVLVKFKKRYPEQKVDISIPEQFIMIPMDPILVEQVLINILENAVQHGEGMTKLSLRIIVKEQKVMFEVEDDGCGISEDRLKTIFVGGYSDSRPPTDNTRNNAGIGLSVCATIIHAHGGEIMVENGNESGCIFRFILDMEEEEIGE